MTEVGPRRPAGRALARWFAGLAFVFPVLLVLVWTGPFDLAFFGAPFVLLGWALAALAAMASAIWWAAGRAWRQVVMASILLVVTVVAAAGGVWGYAIDLGEHIHFYAVRNQYLDRVAHSSAPVGERLEVFDWGGFGVSHAVVYDDSDEIQLPPENQSESWKRRIQGTELECGVWGSPLGNHFYLVRIGC
jgi:hypothetical protein